MIDVASSLFERELKLGFFTSLHFSHSRFISLSFPIDSMNYSDTDFMQVRRLVSQYELEPDPKTRLDDSVIFRASDQVHRAKLAICSLRERAMVVSERLSSASSSCEKLPQQLQEEGSIWFDEAISPELLCMVPIAVACCPDLLFPEILVHAVLTVRHAGALLKECLVYMPLLKKECLELLADFMLRCMQLGHTGTGPGPSDPLHLYCFKQSYCVMESLSLSDSWMALTLREALVQKRILASMIIRITVEVLKDAFDFISGILFTDEEIRLWILSCIKSREKGKNIFSTSSEVESLQNFKAVHPNLWPHLKEATVLQLCKDLHVSAEAAFHGGGWTSNLYCHLKVYCILVNLSGHQPNQDEVVFWLHALKSSRDGAKDPSYKNLTKHMFELGVTFLFLVPGLYNSSATKDLFQECFLSFLGTATSGTVPFEQGPELALWLVIQLFFRGYAQVSEYCSKVVGMTIKIDGTCWEDVCHIAHESGVTSDIKSIAKAASSLRPTGPISSTKCNQFFLECLFHLFKSGHCVWSGVDMADSISHCISISAEPIDPILVQILEMFVKACFTPIPTNSDGMQPLPYSFLVFALKPFCSFLDILESKRMEETGEMASLCESNDGRSCPSSFCKTKSAVQAVLASFYILWIERHQRGQGTVTGNHNKNLNYRKYEETSWSQLLRYFPLDELRAYMEAHLNLYEHLFPQWFGLAISLFPDRVDASHLIKRLDGPEGDFISKQKICAPEEHVGTNDKELQHDIPNNGSEEEFSHLSETFSINSAHHVFRNSLGNSIPALKLLKAMHRKSIPARDKLLLQIAIIEDLLPLLLDSSCSETLQEAFCVWWYSLDQTIVEFLTPFFFRCISTSYMNIDEKCTSADEGDILSTSNLHQELVEQPLSFLACRSEIYQTPLVSIFLDVLRGLLVKNRQMCFLASSSDGQSKKEEISKAIDIRDSAVCQVLLENWSRMLSHGDDISVCRTGSLICAFLSSMFYSRPSILRVVHFQGYDIKLVPAVANGVSVLVHFLEFFEDCLKLVEASKLAFMIVLLSNIVRRFHNHSRSSSAAQKVLMHIKSLDLLTIINFLGEIPEPVAWLAITFPFLEREVRDFLEGCLTGVRSGDFPTGPNAKRFQSSALSAIALLNKDGRDHW